MSYVFRCPQCHAEHTAALSIAGRRVRCPDCFEIVETTASKDEFESDVSGGKASDTVVLSTLDVVLESVAFDPYQQWLDIPPDDQPPNFYRLLDLPVFEPDSYVISGAADRQIAKVTAAGDDQQEQLRGRVIEELNRARACLTDPEQKVTYDRRIQKQFKKKKQAESSKQDASEVGDTTVTEEPIMEPESGQNLSESQDREEPTEELAAQEAQTADGTPTKEPDQVAPATPKKAAAPSPPPPVIRPTETLNADLGVRALMHVDEEDEAEGGDTFVNFSDDRTEFESEMDMTPMVDVTFLLLIFFMVTASFSLQKSIEQPVQKQDEPSTNVTQQEFEDNPDYVVVQIDEFDSFRVIAADFDEEAPSEQELLIKLRRARDGKGGRTPTKLLVAAHGDASHGRVIMAMDAGTEVGMEQVQFTLAAEDDF